MIRRYVFWWFTCRDSNKPSGRSWARGSLASATRGCRNLFGNFKKIPMKCGDYN